MNFLNSIWIADSTFEEFTLSKYKEIGLSKLRTSKDSIKTNQVLWKFADSLNIARYDPSLRKEKLVGSYHYFYDRTKELLIITDSAKKKHFYRISMVSTGSFILLSKRNDKKVQLDLK